MDPTGYYHTAEDGKAKGGSYSIWASVPGSDADGAELQWEDTLADVEVGKGRDYTVDPAVVDFFTINYSMTESDTSGSELIVIYDGKKVNSGDVVWGNGKLEITAIGQGGRVDDYNYAWIDNVPGGSANEAISTQAQRENALEGVVNGILTVESLTDTFDMTCAVSGPTGHGIAVTIRRDGNAWNNSGKEIKLVSSFKPEGYVLTDNGFGSFSIADVASGTYTIVDNDYDTGHTLRVDSAVSPVTLNYHTLNYSVTPTNGLVWAYIHAYYTDSEGNYIESQLLESGTPVLEGAQIAMRTTVQTFSNLNSDNNQFTWNNTSGNMTLVESHKVGTSIGVATYTMGSTASTVSCEAANRLPAGSGVDILRLTLDGAPWAGAADELAITLESTRDRGTTATTNNNAVWAAYPLGHTSGGVFSGNVPADANNPYYICVNGYPVPGVTVTVNGSATAVVTVDYFTLTYTLNLLGTATAGTLKVETVNTTGETQPMLHDVARVDTANPTVTGKTYIPYSTLSSWRGALVLTAEGEGNVASFSYNWIYDDVTPNQPHIHGGHPNKLSSDSTLSSFNGYTLSYGKAIELKGINITGTGTAAANASYSLRAEEPVAMLSASAQDRQMTAANVMEQAIQSTAEAEPLAAEARDGVEIIRVTVMENRDLEPWKWDEEDPVTQSQLLLGTSVELLMGDTLDITGTVERYQSGYRLSKNERTSVAYLNTTPGGTDGASQPYIVMPETGEGSEDQAVLDKDGLLVKENAFILTSSNPTVVAVDGYTLTAVGQFGQAVIRIYNTVTGRSAMLTVYVINSEDYQADPTKSIYRSTPAVAAGDGFSIALKADGSVWAWGDNSKGQLGTGDTVLEYSDTPVKVVKEDGTTIRNIVAIAAGKDHALAVDRDGTVYAWGGNATGQLGRKPAAEQEGEVEDTDYWPQFFYAIKLIDMTGDPTDLPFRERIQVVDVAAGNGFSLLLTNEGTAFGVGRNDKGQLGAGYTNDVVGYDYLRDRFLLNINLKGDTTVLGDNSVYTSPYYVDAYFEYAQYLIDVDETMGKFRTVETVDDPLDAFEQIKEYFDSDTGKIGRASCRERVCLYV